MIVTPDVIAPPRPSLSRASAAGIANVACKNTKRHRFGHPADGCDSGDGTIIANRIFARKQKNGDVAALPHRDTSRTRTPL